MPWRANSIRSDVLPALEAGAWAALVPHDIVWFYERAEPPAQHPRFARLENFTDLPAWIDAIAQSSISSALTSSHLG